MKAEIVCIIDRSGSMENIRNDAIGGFNAFVDAQKAVPGEAKFSLVFFDTGVDMTITAADLQQVAPLTRETYRPMGGTALYDAIGKTVDELGKRLGTMDNKPDKVIVAILTDGEENASKEYSREKIAEIVKHQEEKYSWEFIFLGANQDAFAASAALNMRAVNTFNFTATGQGVRDAYADMSNSVTSYRK